MSDDERKIVKRLKMILFILTFLTSINIIILINNKSYALFRRTVTSNKRIIEIHTANEFPKKGEIATKVIKDTIGTTGGVIGVTTSNAEVKIESSSIREYRYSGKTVNNYIYFNCQDGTTYDNAISNCELWQIIGVFKDESGIERLKLIRNNFLSGIPSDVLISSNWTNSNLQQWLNSDEGYLKLLSPNYLKMIDNVKYYLGDVDIYQDTITTYANERKETSCSGYMSTWPGKIALMYPSDYGFSTNSSYWKNTQLYNYDSEAGSKSWLKKGQSEWLLSTSSCIKLTDLNASGNVFNYEPSKFKFSIRPTLYLKSDVKITRGDGTSSNPYELFLEK